MPGYMQWDREVDFEYNGWGYTAYYTYDADLGKSWITAIESHDAGWKRSAADVRDECRDGIYLLSDAEKAMENEEVRQAERAAERALEDGPSESYESIQAKARLLK